MVFDIRNVTSPANRSNPRPGQPSHTFCAEPPTLIGPASGPRRLTPRECERLQGFPDDWTRYGEGGREISDSARYRMIGNAVAVPVVEWIARRIVGASQ